MPPLIIEDEIDAMDSGNESDHDIISTEMLEGIRDISQSHTNVNRREGCYKISDRIKQRQSECEIEFKDMQNMGSGKYSIG